ncbi:MAG: DNA internalization-related competence protein ComEC/Rec2 [Christensenellales bacterium]|jgi:competence protein ComEC
MNIPNKANRAINKRPLLIAAAAFALGVVLGRYYHFQTIYIIVAAVLAGSALIIRKKVFLIICATCVFFAAFLSARAYDVQYIDTGDDMQITGRVYADPYTNDYGSVICMLDEACIDGRDCGNIKLYISGAKPGVFTCGDVVQSSARVEIPKGVRNPGGFDERLYLLSQGIYYKAYADGAEVIDKRGGPGIIIAHARKYLGEVTDSIFEVDTAPIAKAMLLGDTQGIGEETYSAFKDTGMAHVLAVSGLNAVILIAFIYHVLKTVKVGRTPRLVVTLIFIAVYTCVTGLTPSIVRASIMACTMLLRKHFGRQTDTLSTLALSFIIILIINPLDLFTASFQLSFGAVFGMLTIGWQIDRWMTKKLRGLLASVGRTVSASVGATAGTIPVLAATFSRVSTLSIIINIVVIPLASVGTVLVFISSFAGILFGSAAVYIAYMASAFIKMMMAIINAAAAIPFIAFDIASPPWYFITVCFVALLISSKYILIKTKMKAILCGALTATVFVAILTIQPQGMYLVFLDVGQADAAFIKTEQGGQYFIDGGREQSADEVVGFTIRRGYRPNAAFVSHTDDDHFSGIVALYDAGLLKKVYCSWQEEDTVKTAMPDAEVVPLGAGDTVLLDEYTRALVLYPYIDTAGEDKNDMSLVLLIEYKGHTALFAGDITGATETYVFAGLPKVDIYKAAHHGSKYSSYRLPLSTLTPEYSVISVGSNSFGHPNAQAICRLEDYSEEIYITKDNCAIEFYIDDKIITNSYGGGNAE